jgi:hypothetical protein
VETSLVLASTSLPADRLRPLYEGERIPLFVVKTALTLVFTSSPLLHEERSI